MEFHPIETERLLLRKYTEDDFDDLHAWAGNYENVMFLRWGPNTAEDSRDFLERLINDHVNFQYSAELKETGRSIGRAVLGLETEPEIGWFLHRDYWRLGYGTEIGCALLRFAFETLGVRRIVAHCAAENVASYGVMEKIGMRREGRFVLARPTNRLSGSDWCDELSYAILREEWEQRRESYERNTAV